MQSLVKYTDSRSLLLTNEKKITICNGMGVTVQPCNMALPLLVAGYKLYTEFRTKTSQVCSTQTLPDLPTALF